ncbi:MAG: YdcF family protein [Pseudomonadota bacterium]
MAVVAWGHLWAPRGVPDQADAIICLGAGMAGPTSPEPGRFSRQRAETCARLYNLGVAPIIIFTGEGNDVSSAAAAMDAVAAAAGVPDTARIVEPLAQSTIQNADYSLPLLPDGARRIVIVSDGTHLPRSWVIFRAFGVEALAAYPTPRPRRMTAASLRLAAREATAIWFNVWRGGLYAAGGLAGIPHEERIAWFD